METVTIECPQCQTQGSVDRTWEGRTIKCAQCGTAFSLKNTNAAMSSALSAGEMRIPSEAAAISSAQQTQQQRRCPYCAESILSTALVCHHCKQNLVNPSGHATHRIIETSLSNGNVVPGFKWKEWTAGRRIIFVSTCLAVLAQFFPWVDIGIASSSGISQEGFLFLGFFVYPCIALFRGNRTSLLWGLLCALGAVGAMIVYIDSKSVDLFGAQVNATAGGAYLFFLCALALGAGVLCDHFRQLK